MAKKKTFSADYNQVEQQVWPLAEPIALSCGCELIDVEYVKEAGHMYLRLFIDREPPIDHDCCESVSIKMGDVLDNSGILNQNYFLEVSSPGVNRAFKREGDFLRYKGREIVISLYAPWQGHKDYRGILLELTEEAIVIEQPEIDVSIPRELVAKASLA